MFSIKDEATPQQGIGMDSALPLKNQQQSDNSAAGNLLRELEQGAAKLPAGHVDLHSLGSVSVPLNDHVFDNDVVINSLQVNRPQFNVSKNQDGSIALTDINGLALDVTTYGTSQTVPINTLRFSPTTDGTLKIDTQLQNLVPAPVQKVFAAAPTLPFDFTVSPGGQVQFPSGSQLFESMSHQTGPTLPGMIFRDAMQDAASVALFTERHRQWTNEVMAPFLSTFAQNLQQAHNGNSHKDVVTSPPGQSPQKLTDATAQLKLTADNPQSAPAQLQAGQTYNETMTVDGRQRTFDLHVPTNYDPSKPTPVVLMMHGLGQTAEALQKMVDVNAVADKNGFIVAYPNAVDWFNINGYHVWDTGNGLTPPGQHANDVQFVNNIIDSIEKQGNVDNRRVYMAGLSNGGMLTFLAGTQLAGRLAGIAVVSGAMSGKEPQPSEPLSVINIHGTADPIIPINGITDTPPVLSDAGTPTFQPTQWATDFWKKADGITAPYTVTHDGKVTIEQASNPANGTAVEQYVIHGSGHIPDDRQQLMQQVWDFFQAHPKPTAPNLQDDHISEPGKPIADWTTVHQLEDDVNKRGVNGMETDFDNIYAAARTADDGTISPSQVFDRALGREHLQFSDPASQFVLNTQSISKTGDHVTINRKGNIDLPVDADFGPGALKSVSVGNVSFDMSQQDGYPQLAHIQGIRLNAQVAGFNLSSRIEGITERPAGKNANDGRIYDATMQNPLPSWLRTVLFSPAQVDVNLKFDSNGQPHIVDAAKTQSELIGKNPWTGGLADTAQDGVNAFSEPSAGKAIKLASDVAIAAGLTYLGARLGGKILGSVGMFMAPAAIDGVHRLEDAL